MPISKTQKAKLEALPPTTVQKSTNPFLYVVVFAVIGLLSAVAILALRPESDIIVVTGVVGGLVTSITLSFMGYLKSSEANEQSKETYHLVNSRMTMALDDAIKAAIGEGRKQGRRESEARTDKLAKMEK
jgi:hypothetical protein